MGTHIVVGGVISPVHDAYAKKELASATHRCAMLRLALQNSDWIRLSSWETRQNGWTKTRLSLQHHQNLLNSVLFDPNNLNHISSEDLEWIPENVKNSSDCTPIQIKLLCGADLLESFGTYDLWAEEDIDAIVGEHGLVVITREGSNPNKFIYDSDILSRHMHNIYIVTEWIPNEVSSSRIRRALKRSESVRYLLQDAVIDYVYKHGIYDAKTSASTITHIPRSCKLELTSPNANNYLTIDSKYQSTFLTPSPSDVTMESPSPIEIISIDVPDTVLRKNIQNASSALARHGGLEEAREKFINALVAENGNGKHLTTAKAAYPGLAKQIIATETGESQILDEVGFVDDDRMVRKKVVRVQPRSCQVEQSSPSVATSSKTEETAKTIPKCYVEPGVDIFDEIKCQTVPEDDTVVSTVDNDLDRKSSMLSSGVPVSVDDSGRHECALSDFSVDKEDYRLTRYGLDTALDDEIQEQNDDPRLEERSGSNNTPKLEQADRMESNEFGDNFPNDSVRCSNTQVLVLVSAMIHNPFEKETATLILEESGVQGKGEITIYKGESDGSIDKLLLVQSPVPSSVSDESTVKIQEIVDDPPETVKSVSGSSLVMDEMSNKRDVNLEIDGKYLKSVVNSRKSPRKTKNGQMLRVHSETEESKVKDDSKTEKKSTDSYTQSEETFYKTLSKSSSKVSSSRTKSPRKDGKSSRSQKSSSVSKAHESTISDDRLSKDRSMSQYYTPMKGSLDSVIASSDSRTMSRRRSRAEESFTKKSKSCESIKKIQEVCYEDSSKADSTSQLITANDLDMQTDEFCSVCCYANEMSMGTEECVVSPSQENFYTLRSNCSSIGDEDSTECDICSSWNLQESTDGLDRRIPGNNYDQLCEVCEICGETTFDSDQEIFTGRDPRDHSRILESSTRSLPKNNPRITDITVADPHVDEDSFEIENCGLPSGPNSTKTLDRGGEKHLSSFSLSDTAGIKNARDNYFIPKDEIEILSSGSRRIGRKASLIRKKSTDPGNAAQDKRRYSSVDNLQLAKVSSRNNDKVLRPKNSKLIGSADNIRAQKSSRRCKSLQRSADNIRYVDSSMDNLDSLVEGLDREDDIQETVDWTVKPRIRDNETVKMILTKHGIKIISEKETAL
ncbi:Nicotinamide mononucleotide adenylyltransferase 1 [Dufourea novaeangliae]|uniref:Nicotinamide/nicotinic acid mononucleotide adenylyltransferase 3 n=1 Tax=Dufourea novaeangliae TaxID=178035 RepID=A0A154PKP7_DUFNO|nr:Nicotinamide mononucleotide adenylyltransferase 1 [Dufourea novaeangliae]